MQNDKYTHTHTHTHILMTSPNDGDGRQGGRNVKMCALETVQSGEQTGFEGRPERLVFQHVSVSGSSF